MVVYRFALRLAVLTPCLAVGAPPLTAAQTPPSGVPPPPQSRPRPSHAPPSPSQPGNARPSPAQPARSHRPAANPPARFSTVRALRNAPGLCQDAVSAASDRERRLRGVWARLASEVRPSESGRLASPRRRKQGVARRVRSSAHRAALTLQPDVDRVFADAQRWMRVAVRRADWLTPAHRHAALLRLEHARLRHPAQDRAGRWLDPTLVHTIDRACNRDWLADDAFAAKDGQIILCPGLLLASFHPGEPGAREAFRDRLAAVVAHELGHVVHGIGMIGTDGRVHRELPDHLEGYVDCLAASLPMTEGTARAQLHEIAADEWASQALSVAVSELDVQAAQRLIERGLEPICTSVADEAHPAGVVRGERIFGAHPAVRKLFRELPLTRACSFSELAGAVPDGMIR